MLEDLQQIAEVYELVWKRQQIRLANLHAAQVELYGEQQLAHWERCEEERRERNRVKMARYRAKKLLEKLYQQEDK